MEYVENEEENETQAIVDIMAGMKFYDVYTISINFGITTICTYRSREQVFEAFDGQANITEIVDIDDIMDAFSEDGIFCVELHNTYKNLKSLAEDLVISRISGMMEKEI
jgi:hypothetical protein